MRATAAAILAMLMPVTSAQASNLTDCSQRVDLLRTVDGCTHALNSSILNDRLTAMALNNRANAYGSMAAYDLAIADYDKAIAIEPTHAHGYLNRGSTHLEARHIELAIADFNRALQIDPGLVQAFVNRGMARLEAGLIDRAIDDFTVAIALEPQSAVSHNNRGVAYRRKGRIAQAIADFEAAIELVPAYGAALNNRTEVLNLLARSEEADPGLQRTGSPDPMFESIRRNLLLEPNVK